MFGKSGREALPFAGGTLTPPEPSVEEHFFPTPATALCTTLRHLPPSKATRTASGSRAITFRSVRAAVSGARRPCPQLRTALSSSPKRVRDRRYDVNVRMSSRARIATCSGEPDCSAPAARIGSSRANSAFNVLWHRPPCLSPSYFIAIFHLPFRVAGRCCNYNMYRM